MINEEEARKFLLRLRAYGISFDNLAFDRFKDSERFDFLEEDVVERMCNLLVEISNQCKLQFLKLKILQDALAGSIEIKDGEVSIGLDSFKESGS